ncbi:Bifunctional protein PutA [compost metagenome]
MCPQDAVARSVRAADVTSHAETVGPDDEAARAAEAFRNWAVTELPAVADACARFAEASPSGLAVTLAGPTGERNTYTLLPREHVLCLAAQEADLALQLGAVLTVGACAVWPENPVARGLFARLPKGVQSRVRMVADWTAADIAIDAVLHHGDSDQLRTVCEQVAARPGPIIGVQGLAQGEPNVALDRLLIERSLSVNTAAAGGNASLMTIG